MQNLSNTLSRIENYLSQNAPISIVAESSRSSRSVRLSGYTIFDYSDTESITEDRGLSIMDSECLTGPAVPPSADITMIDVVHDTRNSQDANQSIPSAILRGTVERLALITDALVAQRSSLSLQFTKLSQVLHCVHGWKPPGCCDILTRIFIQLVLGVFDVASLGPQPWERSKISLSPCCRTSHRSRKEVRAVMF